MHAPTTLVVALLLALLPASTAVAQAPAAPERFRFIALGDTQDVSPVGLAASDAFLKRLAAERAPAFAVHIGDLKSSFEPCDDALFEGWRDRFQALPLALVYTPGDNDWTDCHIEEAGAYDPIERLKLLRRLLVPPGRSLGAMPLSLERDPQWPENARWQFGGFVFAALHVVGSNNNLRAKPAAFKEHMARSNANLGWLRHSFAIAEATRAAGVVLFIHANPKFNEGGWWRPTGFDRFLEALAQEVARFGRPVLLVHGDTHRFRIDSPLRDREGQLLGNFTRIEVFGPPDLGAVEIEVDPAAPEPFGFRPLVADEAAP